MAAGPSLLNTRGKQLPWLVLLLLAITAPIYLDKFLLGLLIQIFILAVFALSYNLLLGYTGIVSFGHAMFFGTGTYLLGILLKHAHFPLLQALPIVILAAVLLAVFVGLLSLRVKGHYYALVTMAFAEAMFILSASSELRPWTGGDEGLHGIPVPDWLSPTAQRVTFYYVAFGFCLPVYLLARQIVNSPGGRVLLAIRENENRAAAIGYNTFACKLMITVIAGTLATLAGSLNALFFRSATPEVLGVGRTIDALLMTIIGGVGTLIGPFLGAAVMRLLGNYMADWFGYRWPIVFGLLYILLVMFVPYGLVGTWQLHSASVQQAWQKLWKRPSGQA